MKLSLSSFAILALAGLALAQDNSSPSSSSSSLSLASPSATPDPSKSSNSTAPVASSTAVNDKSLNSTSLASNATSFGVPSSSAGNVTASNSTVNDTGPAIPANTPANVTVPSTASASCSSFLTDLNTNSDLQNCLAPSLKVLGSENASIDTFCNVTASQACPSSTIRRLLAFFSGNCSQELASSDESVVSFYDALYIIVPLTQAACAKDTNGDYCSASKSNTTAVTGSGGSGGAPNVSQQPLGADGFPNTDAFNSRHILFLGANPDLDEQDLCTTCTRNVLSPYFAFEALMPYPGGLAKSQLLAPQNALYSSVQTKCPADFLSSALDNAGAAPNMVNGAISFVPAKGLIYLVAAGAGFLSL